MINPVALLPWQSIWSNIFYKLFIVKIQVYQTVYQFLVLASYQVILAKYWKIHHHIAKPSSIILLHLLKFVDKKSDKKVSEEAHWNFSIVNKNLKIESRKEYHKETHKGQNNLHQWDTQRGPKGWKNEEQNLLIHKNHYLQSSPQIL